MSEVFCLITEPMSKDENNKLEAMRHSCEHVLTMAMLRLWPGKVKAAMGPATEEGFYFDFDSDEKISEDDFETIEKEMAKIIKEDLPIIKDEMTVQEARDFFNSNTYKGNEYKHEWIDDIEARGDKVAVYWMGEKGKDIPETFVDICSGPHVDLTGQIGPFKLLNIAGAYWHGDEKNKMLTRIYGTTFETQQELDEYLKMLEEARKRDHRKIGKELDLFCFSDLVGPGLPLFTPKGTAVRNAIADLLNRLKEEKGYEQVDIPHLAKCDLYKTSGHWDKFKDDIFHVKGKSEEFVLKPMNCPHHTQIYACQPRSYRDLPLRYAEITKQYRDEQTGELHGLSRVRSISIDDTHVFCRPDQILEEAKGAYDIIFSFYKVFGMELEVHLSVRDSKDHSKYLGTDEIWDKAEENLKQLLKQEKCEYELDEGEAAFYGPKLDFVGRDSIGRTWQLATIQLDFNMPDRFGLEYADAEGGQAQPVMLHIAIAGSLERFLSVILEHFAGVLPLWLAPVQLRLISVGEGHVGFANELAGELKVAGVRAEVDSSDETVGNKIRKSAKDKIPWTIVLGDKEVSGEPFKIRVFGQEDELVLKRDELADKIKEQEVV